MGTLNLGNSGTVNLGGGASFTGGTSGFLANAPSGTIIKTGSYYTGSGTGASTTSSSGTYYTININGSGQVLRNMTKAGDDLLAYNKISNDSHLHINVEFPTYLDSGTNGMGFRVRLSVDGGSNYLYIPDNLGVSDTGSDSENSLWASWGLNGYGGHTADHLSCKYTTDSYTANADTIRTHTGEVRIYFEGRVHASGSDTAYWISYSNQWRKAGYVYIEEVKN